MSTQDTVSSVLALLLQGDGLHNNTWGDLLNTDLSTLESAITGVSIIDMSQGSVVLTAEEATPRLIIATGAMVANSTLTLPATLQTWNVVNLTTGGFSLTLLPAAVGANPAGTGVAVVSGLPTLVYADGANIVALTGSDVPIGIVEEFWGLTISDPRYAWANGQAISRTTFNAALNALTVTSSCTLTKGATTLPSATNILALGIIGATVEGVGVPTGTILEAATATTVTLSNAVTGAGMQTLRFFPYGNGDGATTFNLPDRREVAAIGQSTMGDTAARGFLPGTVYLGQNGGEATHTLVTAEMPAHTHTPIDPGHLHGINDPAHAHTTTVPAGGNTGGLQSGATGNVAPGYNNTAYASTTSTTGITIQSSTTGITLASTGGGGAHNNMQPYTVCNYIIRVQ